MILVPLEHWGVVIHVLHLDAQAEVSREPSTVQGPYQEAVPLLGLVIQSSHQIEFAGARVYPEEVVAVLTEDVAYRQRRRGVWIGSVRHVQRYVKRMRLRHGDANASRSERRCIIVYILYDQLHLQINR